ncbi:MAG TPA: exodeoxyribonuclease III, partial [Rhizomicrobium sp.]|nr:exodeoxyribonuclease III [Rhizomicrobium sp.]
EAVIQGDAGMVRVASIYAPNGNPFPGPKFAYKLAWLERLRLRAKALLANEEAVVLMGDYNIIPQDEDAANPKAWLGDALFQPESKAALRRIENLGYTDAFRTLHPEAGRYTFWDYQAGSWQKNNGIRIDHILLSPQAADRLKGCDIDKHVRDGDKPSDHVPIWCELAI